MPSEPATVEPAPSADTPAVDLPEEPDDDGPDGCDDDDLPDDDDDDCDDGEEGDDEDTEPAPPEPSAPSTASAVVRIAGLLTDGSPAVYDGDRCWGCERGCTYRKMRVPGCSTADAVRAHAERCYRSERGYASDRDAADGDVGDWRDLPREFSPIAVARAVGESKRNAWYSLCESCSSFVRLARSEGRDPWRVVPVAVVAADDCPF